MPRRKDDTHLYELAKRGAQAQLRDLAQEARYLLGLFPDLRDSFDSDELPINFLIAERSGALENTRGRRKPMSAAARKAASARMKKYWAGKRKTIEE
jgi:hypothetical protein